MSTNTGPFWVTSYCIIPNNFSLIQVLEYNIVHLTGIRRNTKWTFYCKPVFNRIVTFDSSFRHNDVDFHTGSQLVVILFWISWDQKYSRYHMQTATFPHLLVG